MERVRKMIRAAAQDVFPYTGKGVTAAILDSGIAMHPDIRKNVAAFYDFVDGQKTPYDDSGHGTHVAGCLCGNGFCSGKKYAGIAPDCRIVACKVLDEKGEGCAEDMIRAIRWCIQTKELYGTRILSLSVGLSNLKDSRVNENLQKSLHKAWDAGMLPIVAAGNSGPAAGTMSPLGYGNCVIAVGCYDGSISGREKKCCEVYSGRGPVDSSIRKPDIVAPGTGILSCSAQFQKLPDGRIKRAYVSMDGTSMAVPQVSAAAALLWQKYPHFSNAQIKELILRSARDLKKPWNYQGWGLLDVKAALNKFSAGG